MIGHPCLRENTQRELRTFLFGLKLVLSAQSSSIPVGDLLSYTMEDSWRSHYYRGRGGRLGTAKRRFVHPASAPSRRERTFITVAERNAHSGALRA